MHGHMNVKSVVTFAAGFSQALARKYRGVGGGGRYFIRQLSDAAFGLFAYRCDRPLY